MAPALLDVGANVLVAISAPSSPFPNCGRSIRAEWQEAWTDASRPRTDVQISARLGARPSGARRNGA